MTIQDSIPNLPKNQVTKICSKCGDTFPATSEFFHKDRHKKDGLRPSCKHCTRALMVKIYNENEQSRSLKIKYNKEYRAKPEIKKRIKAYNQSYYHDDPERTEVLKEKAKQYRSIPEVKEHYKKRVKKYYSIPENKAKLKAWSDDYYIRPEVKERCREKSLRYYHQKKISNPMFRLNRAISRGVYRALKENKNARRSFEILGYSSEELQAHLERQFVDGMTWDNYGKNGWHIDHKIPVAVHNFEKPEDEDFKKCWALENLQPMWASDNMSKGARIEKPFQKSLIFGCGDNDD